MKQLENTVFLPHRDRHVEGMLLHRLLGWYEVRHLVPED
jgi:hypothetical protein